MHNENHAINDDIDIVGLIETLWAQRWFIGIVTLLCMLAALTFHVVTVSREFTATTLISPISSTDFEQYRAINELGVFQISPGELQSLYLEQLQDRDLLKDVIIEHGLVEKQNEDDDQEFEEAINTLILRMRLSVIDPSPSNMNGLNSWSLQAIFDDQTKWSTFLTGLDQRITNNIRNQLQNSFDANHRILTTKRRFDLEDIDRQVSNAISDYEFETARTLAFLQEQASIARVLDLANDSTHRTASALATDVTQRFPSNFYLRGYRAIEQEIALMENRQNIETYIQGYSDLQAARRTILQDQNLARARELFQTPIASDENERQFRATRTYISSTEFDYKTGRLASPFGDINYARFCRKCRICFDVERTPTTSFSTKQRPSQLTFSSLLLKSDRSFRSIWPVLNQGLPASQYSAAAKVPCWNCAH